MENKEIERLIFTYMEEKAKELNITLEDLHLYVSANDSNKNNKFITLLSFQDNGNDGLEVHELKDIKIN